MSEPLTVDDLPDWFIEHEQRLAAVEANQQFMWNLLALSPYGVKLPVAAPRDPRVLRRTWLPRPRQGGHL